MLDVNENDTYQRMEGFGAAMTDSSAYLISQSTSAGRTALMNDLFSSSGIGISFLRLPMGASDFALSAYSYDDLAPGHVDRASGFRADAQVAAEVGRQSNAVMLLVQNQRRPLQGKFLKHPCDRRSAHTQPLGQRVGGNARILRSAQFQDRFQIIVDGFGGCQRDWFGCH